MTHKQNAGTQHENNTKKPVEEPQDKRSDIKVSVTEELNGPEGPEPTRYGDWERKGRVSDF